MPPWEKLLLSSLIFSFVIINAGTLVGQVDAFGQLKEAYRPRGEARNRGKQPVERRVNFHTWFDTTATRNTPETHYERDQATIERTLLLASALQDNTVEALGLVIHHLMQENPHLREEKFVFQHMQQAFLQGLFGAIGLASSITRDWCTMDENDLLQRLLTLASKKLSIYEMENDINILKEYMVHNDLHIQMPAIELICSLVDGISQDIIEENSDFDEIVNIPIQMARLNEDDSKYLLNVLRKMQKGHLAFTPKLVAGILGILPFNQAKPDQMESKKIVIQGILNGQISIKSIVWNLNPYKMIKSALERSTLESDFQNIEGSVGKVIDLLNTSKQKISHDEQCANAFDSDFHFNATFLLNKYLNDSLPKNVLKSLAVIRLAINKNAIDAVSLTNDYYPRVYTAKFKYDPCLALLSSLLERIKSQTKSKIITYHVSVVFNYVDSNYKLGGTCQLEDNLKPITINQKNEIKELDGFIEVVDNSFKMHNKDEDQVERKSALYDSYHGYFIPSTIMYELGNLQSSQKDDSYHSENTAYEKYAEYNDFPKIVESSEKSWLPYVYLKVLKFRNAEGVMPKDRLITFENLSPGRKSTPDYVIKSDRYQDVHKSENKIAYSMDENDTPDYLSDTDAVFPSPQHDVQTEPVNPYVYLINNPNVQELSEIIAAALFANADEEDYEEHDQTASSIASESWSDYKHKYALQQQDDMSHVDIIPEFQNQKSHFYVGLPVANVELQSKHVPLISSDDSFKKHKHQYQKNQFDESTKYSAILTDEDGHFVFPEEEEETNHESPAEKSVNQHESWKSSSYEIKNVIPNMYIINPGNVYVNHNNIKPDKQIHIPYFHPSVIPNGFPSIKHHYNLSQESPNTLPMVTYPGLNGGKMHGFYDKKDKWIEGFPDDYLRANKSDGLKDSIEEVLQLSVQSNRTPKPKCPNKIKLILSNTKLLPSITCNESSLHDLENAPSADSEYDEVSTEYISGDPIIVSPSFEGNKTTVEDLTKKEISNLFGLVNKSNVNRKTLNIVKEYVEKSPAYKLVTSILSPNASRASLLKTILEFSKMTPLPPQMSSVIHDVLQNIIFQGQGALPPAIVEVDLKENGNVEISRGNRNETNSYHREKKPENQTNTNEHLTFVNTTAGKKYISNDNLTKVKDVSKLDFRDLLAQVNTSEVDINTLNTVEKYIETSPVQKLMSNVYRPDISRASLLGNLLEFAKNTPLLPPVYSMIDEIIKSIEMDGKGALPPVILTVEPNKNLMENEGKPAQLDNMPPIDAATSREKQGEGSKHTKLDIKELLTAVNASAVDTDTLKTVEHYLKNSMVQELVSDSYKPDTNRSFLLQNFLKLLKTTPIPPQISYMTDKMLDNIITDRRVAASPEIPSEEPNECFKENEGHELPLADSDSEGKKENISHNAKIDIQSLLTAINVNETGCRELHILQKHLQLSPIYKLASSIYQPNISRESLLRYLLTLAKMTPIPSNISSMINNINENIIDQESRVYPQTTLTDKPETSIVEDDVWTTDDSSQDEEINFIDTMKKDTPNLFAQVNASAVDSETLKTVEKYIIDSPIYEFVSNIYQPNISRASLLRCILLLAKLTPLPSEVSSMIDKTLDNIVAKGKGALPPVILAQKQSRKFKEDEEKTSGYQLTEINESSNNDSITDEREKKVQFITKIDIPSLVNSSLVNRDLINTVQDYLEKSPVQEFVSHLYRPNINRALFLRNILSYAKMTSLPPHISSMIDNVSENIISQESSVPSLVISADEAFKIHKETEDHIVVYDEKVDSTSGEMPHKRLQEVEEENDEVPYGSSASDNETEENDIKHYREQSSDNKTLENELKISKNVSDLLSEDSDEISYEYESLENHDETEIKDIKQYHEQPLDNKTLENELKKSENVSDLLSQDNDEVAYESLENHNETEVKHIKQYQEQSLDKKTSEYDLKKSKAISDLLSQDNDEVAYESLENHNETEVKHIKQYQEQSLDKKTSEYDLKKSKAISDLLSQDNDEVAYESLENHNETEVKHIKQYQEQSLDNKTSEYDLKKSKAISDLLSQVNISAVDHDKLIVIWNFLVQSPEYRLVSNIYRPNISKASLLRNVLLYAKLAPPPSHISPMIDEILSVIPAEEYQDITPAYTPDDSSQIFFDHNENPEDMWTKGQDAAKANASALFSAVNTSGVDDDTLYYVREYLEKSPLQQLLSKHNKLRKGRSSLLKKILLFTKMTSPPPQISSIIDEINENITISDPESNVEAVPMDEMHKIDLEHKAINISSVRDISGEAGVYQVTEGNQFIKLDVTSLFSTVNASAIDREMIKTIQEYLESSQVYKLMPNLNVQNTSKALQLKDLLQFAKKTGISSELSSMIDHILDNIIFEETGTLPPKHVDNSDEIITYTLDIKEIFGFIPYEHLDPEAQTAADDTLNYVDTNGINIMSLINDITIFPGQTKGGLLKSFLTGLQKHIKVENMQTSIETLLRSIPFDTISLKEPIRNVVVKWHDSLDIKTSYVNFTLLLETVSPKTPITAMKKLTAFLKQEEIYNILKGFNFKAYPTRGELLVRMLHFLKSKKLTSEILISINEVLPWIRKDGVGALPSEEIFY